MRTKSQRAQAQYVLVASSSAALRKRWSQGVRGFAILEADQRAALEQSIVQVGPAVIFIDLALPGLGGLAGVPAIQRLNPAAKIVLLASVANEGEAVFALVAGARGYCHRNIGPSLVRKATEVVERGEVWIARRVIPLLLRKHTQTRRCVGGNLRRETVARYCETLSCQAPCPHERAWIGRRGKDQI